jgi:hypothetical protein
MSLLKKKNEKESCKLDDERKKISMIVKTIKVVQSYYTLMVTPCLPPEAILPLGIEDALRLRPLCFTAAVSISFLDFIILLFLRE